MAEAILFGHRALQPLIDIQEKLRELVGKPKRVPYSSPARTPCSTFADTAKAGGEFVVVDVETTGTRPQDGRPRRDRRGARQGRQDHRPLVHPREPRAARSSATRCTASPTRTSRAPRRPAEAARKALDFVGDAPFVGHSVGFDIAFLEEALGDGTRVEPGHATSTRSSSPARATRISRTTSSATLANFFGVELTREPPRAAGRRGHGEPADLVRQRPARPDRGPQGRHRRRDPRRPATDDDEAAPPARGRPPRRPRQQEPVRPRPEEDRPPARADEGVRMDGRATDEIRPISVEVGLLPRAHGSGLFTRGQTQALTVATLGPSSDVQRIDTISPETEKRYLHHYNFPPYSTGENKPMRGPSPPRHRPRQPRRPRAPAGPPDAGGVPVRHPPRLRGRGRQRLHLDGVHLRLHPRPDGRGRADQGARSPARRWASCSTARPATSWC